VQLASFSDADYSKPDASGTYVPVLRGVLAWVVHYTGVTATAAGPVGGAHPTGTCDFYAVFDADSGRHLIAFQECTAN